MENKKLSQKTKVDIDEKAKEVLKETFGEKITIPIDIVEVVKRKKFTLVNALLDENDDGFIIVDNSAKKILGFDTNKLIGVNSSRSLFWKRFIIGHELGHYVLEHKESEKQFARRDHRKGKDKRENAIDYFSAAILMPKDEFKKMYDAFNKPEVNKNLLVEFLANQFQVTKQMAARRIEEVGLQIG